MRGGKSLSKRERRARDDRRREDYLARGGINLRRRINSAPWEIRPRARSRPLAKRCSSRAAVVALRFIPREIARRRVYPRVCFFFPAHKREQAARDRVRRVAFRSREIRRFATI